MWIDCWTSIDVFCWRGGEVRVGATIRDGKSEIIEEWNLAKLFSLSYPKRPKICYALPVGDETSLVIKGMWLDPSTEGLPLIGIFINPINGEL